MKRKIERKIRLAPSEPGVYLFKKENVPIYIGKAKNLSARLKSYLTPSTEKVRNIVEESDDLEMIVVASEKEAFLLEANLIRKHKPKYNVRLKDTEFYPYIRISNDRIPYVEIVKRKLKDGLYFGPYTNTRFVKELLEVLQKIFGFRTCRSDLKRIKRPCFLYHLGQCVGPCIGNLGEHDKAIHKLKEFLSGRIREVLDYLQRKMETHAKMLDFENATKYRDLLFNLSNVLESQGVTFSENINCDVVVHDHDLFVVLRIREGYLMGKVSFEMEGGGIEDFIREYYVFGRGDIPESLIVEENLNGMDYTSLGFHYVGKPRSQIEEELLIKAKKNLENDLSLRGLKREALKELMKLINMEDFPYRIEGIDISHLQGKYTVASLVVFEDGFPKKNDYRRYRLNLDHPNDYEAIRKVVKRRYSKYPLPNLIFVDGGKGQVKAVLDALKDLKKDCPVVGLAKKEEIVVVKEKELALPLDHPALRLLVQIRDETHRFAVGYHRKRREKDSLKSILDEIPGLGPVRKKKLLEHFGSVENVRNASVEEIARVIGSNVIAKRILEKL
ncbi:excinuclease ABC subunit UvrC [Thermotoga sp. KOL6]|uniref:excinuclease ABC subunit UvrC n=1 Tax=Thermotoga sp. KOL6 TaxID=126741 RepID=UPI000C761A45|nr:excinuclease ABC subunit UvrC [Thermotoga sp. KOL6]PLV59019.1 excinuclease ABC subunit C [Thermotoga sp. KOL6]